MKTTEANLRISRWSGNRDSRREGVTIEVQDALSRVVLAKLDLTLEQFALAVTSMMVDDIPCQTWAKDERISRQQKHEFRRVYCPLTPYTDKKELKAWFDAHVFPAQGEVLSPCLNTKGGVVSDKDGGCNIRYSVWTWPETQETPTNDQNEPRNQSQVA